MLMDPGHFFRIPITEKGMRMNTLDASQSRLWVWELCRSTREV